MPGAELRLEFASREALEIEIEQNLRHGRAFVSGAGGVAPFAACTLRLVRTDTGAILDVGARVIMISEQDPVRGVAVELTAPSWREQLAAFATAGDEAALAHEHEHEGTTDDAGHDANRGREVSTAAQERSRHLRGLSPAERMKIAQGSNLADRVLLERIYGSAVWDILLRNPHITVPEVARMARKGNLSRPLIDAIVDNANWVRQDIVRRALLSNPRLSAEAVTKILRATSSRELKLIGSQTAYPALVRAVARKLAGLT